MAHTIARTAAQVLTDKEPAAGAHETSAEQDTGANHLARGIWVFTEIGATGWAAAPDGNDEIIVRIYPRQATAGSNYSSNAPEAIIEWRHQVNTQGAYRFADFWRGVLPRYFVVDVQNRTGQAMAANKLNVYTEIIAENT